MKIDVRCAIICPSDQNKNQARSNKNKDKLVFQLEDNLNYICL